MLYSLVMLRSIFWKPYSHLFIVGDNSGWSIDEDAKALLRIAKDLEISASRIKRARFNLSQVVYYTSQFSLNDKNIYKSKHRISVDYYHGKPEQDESFRKCFDSLKNHRQQISRVRVSTKEMERLIKSSGINSEKVMRIPIGIDTDLFTPQTEIKKQEARNKLGIPKDAIVVGSFQKDGVGWNEGNEPKIIKGPDIFLEVISRLRQSFGGQAKLWVLLSGPARGYVKNGLEKLGVPYRHKFLKDFRELPELYDALDLYIITSREEGGPKACLESMAKGIPLVTTAVGQCKDLVNHNGNAMMAPIDDGESLSKFAKLVIENGELRNGLINKGFLTAKENNYSAQLPLWKDYFEGLINDKNS